MFFHKILDIATFFFAVWQLACAVAPDITTLLIFRLFAGFAGSACLSVGGGLVADLFESKERGVATAVFALGPLLGPVIGPVIGGFLSQASGWRWVCPSHDPIVTAFANRLLKRSTGCSSS